VRVGLVQLCSSDDPGENAAEAAARVREAAAGGAALVLTPEVTNCVSGSRSRQRDVLRHEEDDPTLAALREAAAASGVWVLIGSLALLTHDADARFANRSFLVAPDGGIAARYDKIHMFDVDLEGGESYRESAGFRPGERAVLALAAGTRIGMTVCYDLRFPHLYRDLAKAGAEILTVPAAFTVPTGRAHWEVLLRARAIETGCFVLAPAQVGAHRVSQGPARRTWGHSLAIAPWGDILADEGEAPGIAFADLDLAAVGAARSRIPSLAHDRDYARPATG
jgi:deaminated glutathione amidase